MFFCQTCGNLLLTEMASGDFRFYCRTCPYIFKVEQTFENKMHLERKEVDDVLGGKEAWKDVDQALVKCDSNTCDSTKAYFKKLQIRSADEPETIFYRCVQCFHQWNEN